MSIDMHPQQERILCSIVAAIKYEVPANILLAVAEQEGGKPGLWSKNSNGTYDIGAMQFNTAYLKELKPYGISLQDVEAPGCFSYDLAAWRLRLHLKRDKGSLWQRVANYHSRSHQPNLTYQKAIIKKAESWRQWLEGRFLTYSVSQAKPWPVKTQMIQTKFDREQGPVSL